MTDEERNRALSKLGMDCIDLQQVYKHLGSALGAFGTRLGLTRPDECERFGDRVRAVRARADAQWDRISDEIRVANEGVSCDGPDKWSADLDRMNYEKGRRDG